MEDANTKNLYIKAWFLEADAIEERLGGFPFPWKRIEHQFFFSVAPEYYDAVRAAIATVSQENGSIIYESTIDYVSGKQEDINHQLREANGDEYIVITLQPSEGER